MSNAWRAAVGVGVVAIAIVLFVLLRPGDDDTTPAAETTAPATTEADTTTAETETGETTTEETTTAEEPGPTRFRVQVPAGGPQQVRRLDARQGDRVVLVVTLGYEDEVHIHGYDLLLPTGPGRPPARFAFRADTPGRFAIETEGAHQQIAELRVRP